MIAVPLDAGAICGETVTRSSTALTNAVSRGGPADGKAASAIGADAKAKEDEASASFISLLMSTDSRHGPLKDKDAEGSDSIPAVEVPWKAALASAMPLLFVTGVRGVDKAV